MFVCPWPSWNSTFLHPFTKFSRLPKVTNGFQRFPKVSQGTPRSQGIIWACMRMQIHELASSSKNLHGVPWLCIQFHELECNFMSLVKFHELECNYMSLHAVQFHELVCSYISWNAVPLACMQLNKPACSNMSLHAVTWACMQLHELACSSLSLHAVLLSEQLTRISQCLLKIRPKLRGLLPWQ